MKIMEMPEFMADATNVYRTRYYIVRQKIELRDDPEFGGICSARIHIICVRRSATGNMNPCLRAVSSVTADGFVHLCMSAGM